MDNPAPFLHNPKSSRGINGRKEIRIPVDGHVGDNLQPDFYNYPRDNYYNNKVNEKDTIGPRGAGNSLVLAALPRPNLLLTSMT